MLLTLYFTVYGSDSYPGSHGTQGCREEVTGVPPIFEFSAIF